MVSVSGNYDEGFGREQRKADWVKKNPDAEPSPGAKQPEAAMEVEPVAQEDGTGESGD